MMRGAAVLCGLALACSSSAPPPVPGSALDHGVLARAGSQLISAATITRIAERQQVSARVAAQRAVSDALFAEAARQNLPRATSRSIDRAAAARSLLEQLSRDAQVTPPTRAEMDDIVQERWVELNRPDAVRVTHAVVLNDKPEKSAAARAVAEKLAVALASAPSSEELIKLAQAFPGEGFEIRAEALPFVTADGRVFVRGDNNAFVAQRTAFDLDFAKAANALTEPGQLSATTKTAFGFHLIRLDERVPGVSAPAADLPSLLSPEVFTRRAAKARKDLLDRLKASSPVQVERAADELTSRVQVTP